MFSSIFQHFFKKCIYFYLKDNCFTVLVWFLPCLNMNQPQVYICPLPREPPSQLPAFPAPLGCYRALFEFPESYSRFPLAICFTDGTVYASIQLSPFIPLSPSSSWPCPKSVLHVCISTAALQIGSSVPSFQISYTYVNILFVFLFLT